MQDRFKYRVWHKKRKKIYEVLHLHVGNYENGGDWATVKGFNIITQQDIHIQVQPKDCTLIQCTGLKDKNRKLVYFDDFIKLDDGIICIVKQVEDINDIEYGRVIAIPIFCFNKKYQTRYIPTVISESEVIGNIYENPELLESEKQ